MFFTSIVNVPVKGCGVLASVKEAWLLCASPSEEGVAFECQS